MDFPKIATVVASRTGTNVLTGVVRASFADVIVAKPKMDDPSKLEYQCVLIIKAGDPVLALMKEAMKEAVQKKWGDKVPSGLRNPIRECSEKQYDGFEPGDFFITARATEKPGVIDAAMKPITDKAELYSGCFIRANIGAFAYEKKGNKGVAFGLSHVQKLCDGPSLTGRQSVDKVFSPVIVEGNPFGEEAGTATSASIFD
jgi:hypothetical protein